MDDIKCTEPAGHVEFVFSVIHDAPVETSRVEIEIVFSVDGDRKTPVGVIAGRWALALQAAKTRRKDGARPADACAPKMTPLAMSTVRPSGPASLRRTLSRRSGSHSCPVSGPTPIDLLPRPT
jgi:hypothetical protein